MKEYLRPRNYLLVGGSVVIAAFLLYSDPNGGALTATLAAQLATPIIAVWFAHLARKALFDYADMGDLYEKAKESAIGSAIIFASMCAVIFGLLGLFGNQVRAQDVNTYIPQQAYVHLPVLRAEQQSLWVSHPKPSF